MKRLKIKKFTATAIAILALIVYLHNASFLAKPIGSKPILVAHRGLSQDFDRTGLNNETCTAAQMLPTPHKYLENTIPSMKAAFAYGADIVEFDVHPTIDDRFAVFHDWTVDCRTNGIGITREQTLDSLQALDIGYGYTADGGKTYPFRGEGVGMMPSLTEVLVTFPDRNFIINIKSRDPKEGELLAKQLAALPRDRQGKIMVYGEGFSQGFNDPDRLKELPSDYTGGIWTDRIDLIGPAVKERQFNEIKK